jgi:hypothetical protein
MEMAAEQVANIALDRPTNASSMAAGHKSRLASDGDINTYWSAAADATGPQWWESDLEGVYDLSSVSLRFAGRGSYECEIQMSTDDRKTWKTAVKETLEAAGRPLTVQLAAGTRSSGLRIVLDSESPGAVIGLAEVSVRGDRAR